VVAVYTVSGRDGFAQSLEIEKVEPRRQTGCADLVVEDVKRPVWDGTARESVLRARVRNIGSRTAPPSLARVVDPSTPDPSGVPYSDEDTVPALDPGDSWAVEFRLPYWVYNPDASLRFMADAARTLDECVESNNEAAFEQQG
jgi:hypothetical protein